MRVIGATITRIAAELGADRKTVRSWLQLGQAPIRKRSKRDSKLDPFKPFLAAVGAKDAAMLINYGASF
jgi:transposase